MRVNKRKYRERNALKIKLKKKIEYEANKSAVILRSKLWRLSNPDRVKELSRAARKRNALKRAIQNKVNWLKRKKHPVHSLNHKMGRLLYMSLRGRGGKRQKSWQELVGYSVSDLKAHLKAHLSADMLWDDVMDGTVHIDHVIPIAWWPIKSAGDEAFMACWSMDNLKPMWGNENITKQSRWAGPVSEDLKAKFLALVPNHPFFASETSQALSALQPRLNEAQQVIVTRDGMGTHT